jgi:hypothetical protein
VSTLIIRVILSPPRILSTITRVNLPGDANSRKKTRDMPRSRKRRPRNSPTNAPNREFRRITIKSGQIVQYALLDSLAQTRSQHPRPALFHPKPLRCLRGFHLKWSILSANHVKEWIIELGTSTKVESYPQFIPFQLWALDNNNGKMVKREAKNDSRPPLLKCALL